MFFRGLMQGYGVFTRADGLKYEVGHSHRYVCICTTFLNIITPNRMSMCEGSQTSSAQRKSDHQFFLFFLKGWIEEQHTRGPGHIHLAGWQQLCWRGVSWVTPWHWNLHLCVQRCDLHRPVGWGQEAREGVADSCVCVCLCLVFCHLGESLPERPFLLSRNRVYCITTGRGHRGTMESGCTTRGRAGGWDGAYWHKSPSATASLTKTFF